jgi:hypothetical protein
MLWCALIEEAFKTKDWDIIGEYNGCTVVQDYFHPCPACFLHDYMWITGRGGLMSDNIFYHLMIVEGIGKKKAWRRWLAVRTGWYFYYMWKYIIKRNWKMPTQTMRDLDQYFDKN